ncbi:MAG: glycosyltransferase, partial [Actinomycetes bacterium]
MNPDRHVATVLLVCADAGIGWGGTKGASVHLAEVAAALAAAGTNVVAAVARVDNPEVPPGVSVTTMPGPSRSAPTRERRAAEIDRSRWLTGLIEATNAMVVYERFSLHTAAASRAAAATGTPHLLELNAPLIEEAAAHRHLDEPHEASRLELEVFSQAAQVLAVSRPVAAYAASRGARGVALVPNAVDPGRFRTSADAGAEPPLAVFLGTLRPWHGVDTLTEAWRLLGRRAPRLVVVGDGLGRDRLEDVGAEVTGPVRPAAVPGLLLGCQIGLAPYPADGPAYFSPLKLFEYLAAGLATVAADETAFTVTLISRLVLSVADGV